VTALEIGPPRGDAVKLDDGRHLGPEKQAALHGAPADAASALLESRARESERVTLDEATGVSEARRVWGRMAENAMREPGPPAEADGCVVKRPVPQSPFPGMQAMGRERGASFEEMLGTHEARVLVSEAVGSRNRSERIEFVLPRPVARQAGGGDLAPRKPPYR